MRHEWQCSTCGQIFTRKWNGQRHVKDSHAGNGQVVPVSVYPSGGKGRKHNGGKTHRNGGYFYDYRAPAYGSGHLLEWGIITAKAVLLPPDHIGRIVKHRLKSGMCGGSKLEG